MSPPRPAIFVPCFVAAFRPTTGARLRRLLDRLGIAFDAPGDQTCCGQPSHNAGFTAEAAACAEKFIRAFQDAQQVVVPSASCAAMIRAYPRLPDLDPSLRSQAEALARRTHEISSYLVDVLGIDDVGARFDGAVALHDGCHGLRQLGVRDQPRRLLARVKGLELRELAGTPECCGFGGTFSVKYPEISADMADAKLARLAATGTDTLVSADLSCLLHLEGRARRQRLPFVGLHLLDVLVAEVQP